MSRADWIFLGLGNPGKRYSLTRHNVGFIFLDLLAQRLGKDFSKDFKKDFQAHTLDLDLDGHSILALKPQTYMNLSGKSLQALRSKEFWAKDAKLLVLQDEVDLPFGRLRLKFGGGDAGHNGLKDIRRVLGHGDYFRLRIGVGRPPQGSPVELADYVLQSFDKKEEKELMEIYQHCEEAFALLLKGSDEEARNRLSSFSLRD